MLKNLYNRWYLRFMRIRRRVRAFRLGRRLSCPQDHTYMIGKKDIILFATIYNEAHRLPYFLEYYRKLGIRHFIFIDNNSTDDTANILSKYADVTRYHTDQSYRRAHYGMDWMNWLLLQHANERWALVVDVDEFFVYPYCETRPINALTDWLDASSLRTFPAMLLDMYPSQTLKNKRENFFANPFKALTHFDVGNYTFFKNPIFKNLWIQGGARARMFFRDKPDTAPALNKTPLVKWRRGQVFTSSTHQMLPKLLNVTYNDTGAERISGALLHTKFLPDLNDKSADEYLLSQHYSKAREYQSYSKFQLDNLDFMCKESTKYKDWQQLHDIGIISKGGWA